VNKKSLINLVGQCHQSLLKSMSACRMQWHCCCGGVVLITGNHVSRILRIKRIQQFVCIVLDVA
jgi:hypothetical protein